MNAIDPGARRRTAIPVLLVTGLHVVAWLALIRPHFIEVEAPQVPLEVLMLKPANPPPVTTPPAPSSPSFTVVIPEVSVPAPVAMVMPEPASAAPAPAASARVETQSEALLSVDESELRYLQIPEVRRPVASRRAGEYGVVHLWLYIDEQGHVMEVRVHRSSSFKRLDDVALKAMAQARFLPYTKNGKACAVTAVVPVEFPA